MSTHSLTTFTHTDFGQIRQLWHEGQPWFVLADVRKVLGYIRASDALKHLRHSQFKTADRRVGDELGQRGGRLPIVITESGLYRLMLRSSAKNAEPFQVWVEDELLPTVRKAHQVGMDVVDELKERIAQLEGELEIEQMSTESEPLRNRQAFLAGARAGRANPDIEYGLSERFTEWEQG